jgi:hypothetical protein
MGSVVGFFFMDGKGLGSCIMGSSLIGSFSGQSIDGLMQ